MASTVHSFYQNVYLMDTEMNVAQLKTSIEEQKKRMGDIMADNLRLTEDNKKLKGILKKYREIVRDLQGRRPEPGSPFSNMSRLLNRTDTQRRTGQDGSDLSSSKGTDTLVMATATKQQQRSPSRELSEDVSRTSKENVHLEMIGAAMRKISKSTSLRGLIEALYRELTVLLRVNKLGIFVLDPQLRRLFQQEKGCVQTMHAGKFPVDLVTNDSTFANYNMRPAFTSLSSAAMGIRKSDLIVLPVLGALSTLGEQTYLAVQLEGKTAGGRRAAVSTWSNERWVFCRIESSGVDQERDGSQHRLRPGRDHRRQAHQQL